MFRSLYLTLIYGVLLLAGAAAPFACALGYIWVDTSSPQHIAYSILTEFPVSLVMAIATFMSYVAIDRKCPPAPNLLQILMVVTLCWCTFTTFYDPIVPLLAKSKFDWASRTMLFASFMPFIFRSRLQIEAFLLVFMFAAAIQYMPFGAKTILSGGGYHRSFGLLAGNAGLAEGSFLSATCALLLPLMLYMHRDSLLIPRHRLLRPLFPGLMVLAVACSIGTYERTALVGLAVALLGMWWRTRNRVTLGVIGGAAGAVFMAIASQDWLERMSTSTQFTSENSAFVRILVWRWTLDLVKTHPFGGGFECYRINEIHIPGINGEADIIQHGRAFHSLYFEMLGEQGWPGLALFLLMIVTTVITLLRIARWADGDPQFAWLRNLSISLLIGAAAVFACGAFIGIAYQPVIWYVFASTVMLNHHMKMCERGAQSATARGVADPMGAGAWASPGAA